MTTETSSTSPASGHNADLDPEEAVLAEVRGALKQIEFGPIVIKIHQGKVTGIETSTKLRLDT